MSNEIKGVRMKIEKITAEYVRRKDLAAELGQQLRGKPFCEHTLIQWERLGKGPPAVRIGRVVLYHTASVSDWLRSREKAATKPRSIQNCSSGCAA